MHDVLVTSGDVPIAARDYAGDGPGLLLLHGAGGNLAHMSALAGALSPTYRVVAVDLRGHGRSGNGPWNWPDILADLDAVVADLRLGAPAVVGMSLGGMIATMWADTHPSGPGAVSLDGNPTPSRPDQLAGLTPAVASRELARLQSMFDRMAATLAAPINDDQITAARAGQRAMADEYGDDEQAWVEGFDRSLVERDGATFLRPNAATTAALRIAMAELDLVPAYRGLRCPLLVVLATADMPEQEPFRELYAAYRRYVVAQLATVENRYLRVVPLAHASHAMVVERPRELARLIADFLADPGLRDT
jgi:pimeloyl-ACP methyl ester carboxylesterase